MRTFTGSLLLPLALLACINWSWNPIEANAAEIARAKIPADTSLSYVVVPYDTTYFRLFPRRKTPATGYKPTELSPAEIDACYTLIVQHLEEYNVEHGGDRIDPSAYCFQYMAAISYKGEEIVYINAMCRSSVEQRTNDGELLNWKTELIEVDDGGECFFQVVIDLDLMRVLRFSVNGHA